MQSLVQCKVLPSVTLIHWCAGTIIRYNIDSERIISLSTDNTPEQIHHLCISIDRVLLQVIIPDVLCFWLIMGKHLRPGGAQHSNSMHIFYKLLCASVARP